MTRKQKTLSSLSICQLYCKLDNVMTVMEHDNMEIKILGKTLIFSCCYIHVLISWWRYGWLGFRIYYAVNPFRSRPGFGILLWLTPNNLLVKGRPLGQERVKGYSYPFSSFCRSLARKKLNLILIKFWLKGFFKVLKNYQSYQKSGRGSVVYSLFWWL